MIKEYETFGLLKTPAPRRRILKKANRIYDVLKDEPKDVSLQIFKVSKLQEIERNKKVLLIRRKKDEPLKWEEHDTITIDSDSDSSSEEEIIRVKKNRFKQRSQRVLNMARNLFHINSMKEFCRSARIADEKKLVEKYEDILVAIESQWDNMARKKHNARLFKKRMQNVALDMLDIECDSDVSTPDEFTDSESENPFKRDKLARMSPLTRAIHLHRHMKPFSPGNKSD